MAVFKNISGVENVTYRPNLIQEDNFESFFLSRVSDMMWEICPPIIILFGSFGNIMTIVIIRRMSDGQSSNSMFLYFTALAVSDQIILCAGLLRKWLLLYFRIDVLAIHDVFCKLVPFFVYSFGTISPWLIVSMTIQRVMSVVWPHNKSLSCARRHVGYVVSVIVTASTAFNAFRLRLFATFVTANYTKVVCSNIDDEGLNHFYWNICPYVDMALSSLIPFSMLILGNSVLVWKVIQSVQVARVMTAGSGDQVNSRQKKASSLTVTLITVSLSFLVLTAPVCAYISLDPLIGIESAASLSAVKLIWAVCDLSWYINSALNFYLYCLSGTRFRTEVKLILSKVCTSTKRSTSSAFPEPKPSHSNEDKNGEDQTTNEF